MEQILFHTGLRLIDEITFYPHDSDPVSFAWESINRDAILTDAGEIIINHTQIKPTQINIVPSVISHDINLCITDIAPTMTAALGLPPLSAADGMVRFQASSKRGVLIFIDGLNYSVLMDLIENDQLDFIPHLPGINKGLTIYPPMTRAATAALLTGQLPINNGVMGYGIRDTNSETLFDLAVQNEKSVVVIEGYAITFNLQNAEIILSPDKNGDGFTDDEVLANSLSIVHSNMPALLYIHFHDIDNMGHTYGPDSQAYADAIIRIDQYLETFITALPTDTFVIIFSDHGMHSLENGGNHGHLIKSDMLIPIIFFRKELRNL